MKPAELSGVERVAREHGATIVVRSNERIDRTYGLLDVADLAAAEGVRTATHAKLYDTAIIALAVYPTAAEALPALLDAFGGAGRPSGILECALRARGAVIEWDPRLASAAVVVALIDVELRRFSAGRTAELLSPLPEAVAAGICAEGLAAPEIAPERIIETLVDRAGL
jgi:hypothetical protein